jgi:hypothetical protein
MVSQGLTESQVKALLIKNWMTHDALWYAEVALKLGMAEASPMNLRVCRKLGKIEFKRLMVGIGASPPGNQKEYQDLFEIGRRLFVPEFMSYEIGYPAQNVQRWRIMDCFAHRGMQQASLLPEYECGIFERIFGWFDAMRLSYDVEPDLSRCLKYKGAQCEVTVRFHF